jgi:hypothetical protein
MNVPGSDLRPAPAFLRVMGLSLIVPIFDPNV